MTINLDIDYIPIKDTKMRYTLAGHVDGGRCDIYGGNFNLFIPGFDGKWGLKVLKNKPVELLADGHPLLMPTGYADPSHANENMRLKAEEIINIGQALHGEGLGPKVDSELLQVNISDESFQKIGGYLQSDRYNGERKFWAFRVETLNDRMPRSLLRFRWRYRAFRRHFTEFCIKNDLRRHRSVGGVLTELANHGNICWDMGRYNLIDVDAAYSMGPLVFEKDWLLEYLRNHAAFPKQKRDTQYQTIELDGDVIAGGRETCAQRLLNFGVSQQDFLGKSVLDLGCNVGEVCAVVRNWGAESTLGMDVNDVAVEGAKFLRDYRGMTNMQFLCADLEDRGIANFLRKLAGRKRFDIVFALSIVMHVKNSKRLIRILRRLTGEMLLFEGHADEGAGDYESLLKKHFSSVEHVGFSYDRNQRPLLICRP